MRCIVDGRSNDEIASSLGVGTRTVEAHLDAAVRAVPRAVPWGAGRACRSARAGCTSEPAAPVDDRRGAASTRARPRGCVGVRRAHSRLSRSNVSLSTLPGMSRPPTPRRAAGDQAEEAAARHLVGLGWSILGRNVRIGRTELDIVADRAGRQLPPSSSWRSARGAGHASGSRRNRSTPRRSPGCTWRPGGSPGSATCPTVGACPAACRAWTSSASCATVGPGTDGTSASTSAASRPRRADGSAALPADPLVLDSPRPVRTGHRAQRSLRITHACRSPRGCRCDQVVAGPRTTRHAEAQPHRRSPSHAVRLDAPAAGGRCPLRAPDSPLEPQDEALHLRRAQRHPHHRPGADGQPPGCRARLRDGDRRQRRLRPLRGHQEAGPGARRRGSRPGRDALRQPPLAGRHAHQLRDHPQAHRPARPDRGHAGQR